MKIKRRPMKAGLPALATGDIAFNLLIFFVILAQSQDNPELEWHPAKGVEIKNVGQARVSIVVDVKSKVYLNGRHVGIEELAEGVETALGNAPAGKRKVLLKIDKDAQAITFEPIIEAVSEAGGELVHVLEQEKPK